MAVLQLVVRQAHVDPGARSGQALPGQRPPAMSEPRGGSAQEQLVARCKRGERRAFDELYFAHRRQVAGVLYRVLGPRGDIDDALQDVFFEVFRAIGRFRGESKLSTWLYRLSMNVALRRLRTARRRERPSEQLPADLADGGVSAETAIATRRELACVQELLERLSAKKRIVFVLHEVEGLDIGEIAEIVGAPRITVRTRLHYARKEFQALAASDDRLGRRLLAREPSASESQAEAPE